jgi:hypothetical protein
MLITLKAENRILRNKLNLPEETQNNDVSESLQSIIDISTMTNQNKIGQDGSDLNDDSNNTFAIINIVLTVSAIILLIAITTIVFKKNKTS